MTENPFLKETWPKFVMLFSGILFILWSSGVLLQPFFDASLSPHHQSLSKSNVLGSAISFFLCGSGFVAASFNRFKITRFLGIFVILFIFFIESGQSFEWNLSQDFLAARVLEKILKLKLPLNTAFCFILTGFGLLCLGKKPLSSLPSIVTEVLGLVVAAISLGSILGHGVSLDPTYTWLKTPGMPLDSSVAFFVIGMNLFFYSERALNVIRWSSWIPFVLSCGIFIVFLILAEASWREQKGAIRAGERAEAERIGEKLVFNLKKNQDALWLLAKSWLPGQEGPPLSWESMSEFIISESPGPQEIVLMDLAEKVIATTGSFSSLALEKILNEKVMKKAKAIKTDILSGIYDDNGSLTGMALYVPVFEKSLFKGFVVGLFDVKKFAEFAVGAASKYQISIVHSGNKIVGVNDGGGSLKNTHAKLSLNLLGLHLDLSVLALNGALGKRGVVLPWLVVFAGLLYALLSFFLFYSLQALKKKANENALKQEQLQMAYQTIIDQDKLASLGTLSAGVAHEVKNSINIMKGFSELSLSVVDDVKSYIANSDLRESKDSVQELLQTLHANLVRISEQGKRANNTAQMILSLSRGGKEAELTDVHALLDEYISLSYYAMRAQNPGFTVKILKRYDLSAPKFRVPAEDLSRVFLNLLNNAYYALLQKSKNSSGEFVPELVIVTIYALDHFEIRIRDNGGGIPEAIRGKIFSPFFTTKPSGAGTGLGLSLSHAIMLENGGSLDFISKEGEFTEFHLTLKVK